MQACVRWVSSSSAAFKAPLMIQLSRMSSCTSAASATGILAEYHRLLDVGKLHPDATQLAAVQALQLLQDSMAIRMTRQSAAAAQTTASEAESSAVHHEAATASQDTSLHSIDSTAASHSSRPTQDAEAARERESNTAVAATEAAKVSAVAEPPVLPTPYSSSSSRRPVVQGAYLWGPVGSGKTLLMDMFLRTLPSLPVPPVPSNSSSSSSAVDNSQRQQQQQQEPAVTQQVQITAHRIHYHEFMLAVHEQLHQLQQSLPRIVTYSRAGLPVFRYATPPEDPILVVARAAASGLNLLCLDELHVTDVADAMLLSRLFGEILARGCHVIFTSNRPARDLYKGGLSRKYFEPFIRLIDNRLLQLKVAGGRDYRLLQQQQQGCRDVTTAVDLGSSGIWFVGPVAEQQLQLQWKQLEQQLGTTAPAPAADVGAVSGSIVRLAGGPAQIPLPFGRTLWIPHALVRPQGATGSTTSSSSSNSSPIQEQRQQPLAAAWFTFDQLCSNEGSRQSLEHAGALSSNDYLALVRSCSMIFVQGIPQLTPRLRDEARRLVTLVDLVYEAHTVKPGSVRLVFSAAVNPHELFLPLLGAAAAQGVNPNLGRSTDKLDVKQLVQDYGSQHYADSSSSSVHDLLGASAGEMGGKQQHVHGALLPNDRQSESSGSSSSSTSGGDEGPASPLLPEEVLMYHRASSRLVELCSVVNTAAQ